MEYLGLEALELSPELSCPKVLMVVMLVLHGLGYVGTMTTDAQQTHVQVLSKCT